jgi:hypothetical protein
MVVINLVKKCPLSSSMQQLFFLTINHFAVWTVFIPVTFFRSYLCQVSSVDISDSFSFSKWCLHEIFHPQFCVHFLLHHSSLRPPSNPPILLQPLCFIQTQYSTSFCSYVFFYFLPGLSNLPDIFYYQLEPSCSGCPTGLFPLNWIFVLSTFLDGQTLVAVTSITPLKPFNSQFPILFLSCFPLTTRVLISP